MADTTPDLEKLQDLVHFISVEVGREPAVSFNRFCIAYQLDADARSYLHRLLDESSLSYYGGLDAGVIDVRAVEVASQKMSQELHGKFGWPDRVITDLLRACVASGKSRGFCATVLEIGRLKQIPLD